MSRNRWLFDIGAGVVATNDQKNFTTVTSVELSPEQYSIQTGNETIFGSCMGEVLLSLKGPLGEKSVLALNYVVRLNKLPLKIISGERFYRMAEHFKVINGKIKSGRSGTAWTSRDGDFFFGYIINLSY